MIIFILSYAMLKFNIMGIGDWGLGIGDWAQSPIPIGPIPNPQSPIKGIDFLNKLTKDMFNNI